MKVYLTLMIFLIGASANASANKAVHWEKVRMITGDNAKQCQFIIQLDCSTKRKSGEARCKKWHRKNASKVGADSFVIIDSKFQQSLDTINNELPKGRSTSMTADYYFCN